MFRVGVWSYINMVVVATVLTDSVEANLRVGGWGRPESKGRPGRALGLAWKVEQHGNGNLMRWKWIS